MKLTHSFPTTLLLCAVFAGTPVYGQETATSNSTADLTSTVTRERLADQVDRNVDTLERTMATARRTALTLDPQSRIAFKKVSREVSDAAHELHQSLLAAQRASDAEWEHARAVLAADYDCFAQAVAQAQRIATLGASGSSQVLSFKAQ